MRVHVLVSAGTALVIVLACSSSPRYPACNRDDQCAVSGKHDYCVDGKCVYCRTGADCGDRERCRQGKCEADPDAPPLRALDAGEDGEADGSADEDAGAEEPPEEEEESPRGSQRHVLPRGVRRFLRP
jgi:hypothetical protein